MKELKQRVYESNLELVKRGVVIYTWGNVSAIDREKNLVVIKPRGVEYDDLSAADMSVVDLEGKQIEKGLLPSVDLDIHLALYKRYEKIGGIAHTHSTYASAWAQANRGIPVLGTTHADHFYGEIPCTRILTDEEVKGEYEYNTGELIVETFGETDPMTIPGVLVAGHGPFTWGADPEASVEHCVILEVLAKMAYVTFMLNPGIRDLPGFVLDKHYLRKHGSSSYFYQTK
jgi:L-ribulose-5-phosphate 4-epimerase